LLGNFFDRSSLSEVFGLFQVNRVLLEQSLLLSFSLFARRVVGSDQEIADDAVVIVDVPVPGSMQRHT
jgi:hypothetical protein